MSDTPRWRETAKEPPTAADAIKEDGEELVLAWTDPNSSFAQSHPYNAIDWESVIKHPEVYPHWTTIIQKPAPMPEHKLMGSWAAQILQQIAYPTRGTEQEKMTLQDAANAIQRNWTLEELESFQP